ncbi:MAG: FAD-binding oxidoreductase [Actinomycetota bacterium]
MSAIRRPSVPIPLNPGAGGRVGERLGHAAVGVSDTDLSELRRICPTDDTLAERAEASRDWWPLSMHWSLAGQVPVLAAAVCRPTSTEEISRLLTWCNDHRVPVTAAGGRSGVCGASIPLGGGVVLDTTGMQGIVHVDDESMVVEVLPGTFGPELEAHLRMHGLTLGHYPQSFDISTVGGWVACRGAGQYSTRYGKIEDMVVGLEVVLADGSILRTGGAPRAAVGPDLTQVFVGSEGTLGVLSRVWLRCHPAPETEYRAAYSFDDFDAGLDACRRILQRGGTPAVLRLYDERESQRGHGGTGRDCVLLVLDEGDRATVDAALAIVDEECLSTLGCEPRESTVVDAWMEHRNDTSGLQALTRKGFVVDTMEIAGPWSRLASVRSRAVEALLAVEHARSATCHLSHSYRDGACLYFTFAADPPADLVEATYIAMWDAGTRAILAAGGNLSHHHGVGLNRARFVAESLGAGHRMLAALKSALDPHGILNPGKMGLDHTLSAVWP